MSENRWYSYYDPYRVNDDNPILHRLLWLWRSEWAEASLTEYSDINPAMNVIGLWWAPAIDGKGPPELPTRGED